MGAGSRPRQRPSEELLAALRRAKADLHEEHRERRLSDKVRMVLELQRICLPLIARQRPLRPWERPWTVEP